MTDEHHVEQELARFRGEIQPLPLRPGDSGVAAGALATRRRRRFAAVSIAAVLALLIGMAGLLSSEPDDQQVASVDDRRPDASTARTPSGNDDVAATKDAPPTAPKGAKASRPGAEGSVGSNVPRGLLFTIEYNNSRGAGQLYVSAADHTRRRLLYTDTPDHRLVAESCTWSPRADRIACVTGKPSNNVNHAWTGRAIEVIALAGGAPVHIPLPSDAPFWSGQGPNPYSTVVWSPDGTWILTASTTDGTSLWPARGGAPRHLTDDNARMPAFSPDSRELAYVVGSSDAVGVKVVGVDGSNPRTIADPTVPRTVLDPDERADQPVWSPDGAWIAVRGRQRDHKNVPGQETDADTIDVMRPDGTGRRSFGEAWADLVGWLPDSSGVLATANNTSNQLFSQVKIARLDEMRVTTVLQGVGKPTFSRDGRWVAYDHYSYKDGDDKTEVYPQPQDIRVRDLTGAASEERIVLPGWAYSFSWSPNGDAVAALQANDPGGVEDDRLVVTRVDGRGTWAAPSVLAFAFAPVAG